VLSGTLSLFEVEDVEALCVSVLRQSRLKLSPADHEDALAYLISTCWEISVAYQPSDPPRFAVYARNILRRRAIDWQRARFGRQRWVFRDGVYERPRVELVSLDATEDDRLDAAVSRGRVDDGEHRLADELRELKSRGRRPSRRDDWLGDEAA
jgi:hypothetical protein